MIFLKDVFQTTDEIKQNEEKFKKCCGGKLSSAGYACSTVSERSTERDPI